MKALTKRRFTNVLLSVVACCLVSACTPTPPPTPLAIAEGQFLAELAQFRKHVEQRDLRKKAYDYWSEKLIASSAAARQVHVEREYDRLASSGALGTREQLVAAKKHMNDGSGMASSATVDVTVDLALQNMKDTLLSYSEEAIKVHETYLPPLQKAAQSYSDLYETEYAAARARGDFLPHSEHAKAALKEFALQESLDRAWFNTERQLLEDLVTKPKGLQKK